MSTKMNALKSRITVIAALMFGLIIGIICTKQFSNYAESCRIKYVAQDELMALEQERIKLEPLELKQLFFGKATEAAKLAASLPKAFEDNTTIVVYSTGAVSGKNVKSISREVHRKIVEELQKSNELNDEDK